jgi:glycosyltransferase involved in cell wall biosynthesis
VNKLSVLCYGRFFDEIPGGMQTHTLHLMKGLSDRVDFTHAVASRDANGAGFRAAKRIRVVRTPSWNVDGSLALSPGLYTQSKRLHQRHKFNLVHLHFPDPMAHFASLAIPAEVPRVITWHADITRQKKLFLAYEPMLRRALAGAAAVIAPTPAHFKASRHLSALEGDPRLQVIPFGFDLAEFLAPRHDAEVLRATCPGRRIFALGRHVYYKGFDVLIKAMAMLPPDVKLILGGEGPETARLKSLAADLGVSERVHFTGFVPQERLPAYFQACEVFCLPAVSTAEAFGIVQVEAMTCGKPVVSTRLGNGVEFVNEHGRTGLTVPPGDVRELAGALRKLLDDPELARQLGMKGRERALKDFSISFMCDEMLALYQSVLARTAPLS